MITTISAIGRLGNDPAQKVSLVHSVRPGGGPGLRRPKGNREAVSAMEKHGIRTERGDLNREIEVTNQKLRQLKARISKLQKWLEEKPKNTEPPTLSNYIQGILSRKTQAGNLQVSQSLYNLKDAAKMLNFLQANNIMDMAGLDEKFNSMIGEQLDIQGKNETH